MWSLSLLTIVTIFMAVFCKDDSIARRTLILSGRKTWESKFVDQGNRNLPASLLGLATTTCIHHSSQQTSSSVCPPPPSRPNHPPVIPVFRRLRSKNCTTISPREPPGGTFEDEGDVSWETSSAVWESIAVDISGGSRIAGRGKGSDCVEYDDVCEEDAVGV